MNKLLALFDLFRKGSAVADPAAWKSGQITVTMLAALLFTLGRVADAFGYPLPMDQAAADVIAAGFVALVNIVLTVVTTDKLGLPAKAKPGAIAPADRGRDRGLEAEIQPPQYPQI